MHLDPIQRYESIAEFATDLNVQIKISGEDLVHGAFEAISARNIELARIIADKAARYAPDSDNLAVLKIQLNGGSAFGMPQQPAVFQPGPLPQQLPGSLPVPVMTATGPDQALTLPPMQAAGNVPAPSLPAELTAGLPPEMVQMFNAQVQAPPRKKAVNPILILALGGMGIVLLMLIAAMVTFFLGG
jgi:hypothetical protein